MLKQKYKSFLVDEIFKKQIWMVISVVILISNILLSVKIFSIDTAEKTIVHPINMSDSYSIEGDDISPNYIGSLAEVFLRARFLYTPKTVAKQFDKITNNFHPAIYGDKKSELDVEAAKIIRNDETSVFFPMSSHVKQNTAYIEGEMIGYMGKKIVTQHLKTFEVSFRNSGGRIWLYSWREVTTDSSGKNYLSVEDFPSNREDG